MHELKEVVFITLYLYVTLGAVILMKTAALHTQGVEFTPWGIAIVKAPTGRPRTRGGVGDVLGAG